MKIIVLFGISMVSVVMFLMFFGIEFDREWGNSAPFVKYRPSFKLVYDCPGGEADDNEARRTDFDKKECSLYNEFLNDHSTNPLFLVPIIMFFSIALSSSFLAILSTLNKRAMSSIKISNLLIFISVNIPVTFIQFIGLFYLVKMVYYTMNISYNQTIFLIIFFSSIILTEIITRLVIYKAGKIRLIKIGR